MCVSTINGETHNHTIQEKEPTKQQDIFAMDDSAVILSLLFIGFGSKGFVESRYYY